ncbi:EAL and HDOD domain-containing protein [Sulfurimonas paralvinellae]|uniref:EAL domain-containing protein n=1 Tax=Sulfurimonas paralvinellae TaxID=317658 RepID=A0A7M1BAB6_9BACT|nr:EAL domain-containing protein [Sulfurimonas paralvinellae]QOP46595.1 EAL domain-containing protein [Sulfurimonas paralvinellae]
MKHVYVARQPILDKNSDICAYEVLYRDADQSSKFDNDRHASASVISSVLNKFGTKKILGDKRAFVKVDEKILLNDIIFSIPKEFFIFSIFASVAMNERIVERIAQLHAKGYLLAIDNIDLNDDVLEKYLPVIPYIGYFKVFVKDDEGIKQNIKRLHAKDIKVIGVKIEDEETFELAKKLGCDAFEGYYFAQPKIMENAEYNPTRMAVLRLYNILMEDRNIDEAADEFEKNPEITVQLLQFINSAAFSFRKKISSIHHVIVLIGRIQLAKWLMLMIYSKSVASGIETSPLMLMVKNRTELMERILKEIRPDARSNMLGEAYMVGVLSLMDTLFSMPLEEILKNINVSEDVENALLHDKGLFGEIYKVVRSTEHMDINAIVDFEMKHRLAPNKIKDILMSSIEEVAKLENPSENEE